PPLAVAWARRVDEAREGARAHDAAKVRAALLAMRALSPNNPGVALSLAAEAAHAKDAGEALRWLETYAAFGTTTHDEDFASVLADPRAVPVRAKLDANARPVEKATRVFALPTGDRLFEDVAWDPAARTFYVSSVRGRDVLAVGQAGADARSLTAPERAGLGVSGLAFDAARRTLWTTVAPIAQVPGFRAGDDTRVACAVVAVDPASGKPKRRVELAPDGEPHALTDVAVTPAGDVVASDARGGGVYVLRAGSTHLERLPARFRSPQTPAPRDATRAYVPDYSLGVALVDLSNGAAVWLDAPPSVPLTGIDGLYFVGDALVAVQNGIEPPRISRLALSPDGAHVTGATILEAGTPGLGEPTHGAIVGGELWFLAPSGWARFDDVGALVNDPPPDATAIWRVPIR
ncbi:MAG TPA: hypothetical protein VHB21_04530, partial [Minicystis sp.]|nr:hypothetical protein [Minicystis sp.]